MDTEIFSRHYSECKVCHTLICNTLQENKFGANDSDNFYGKDYWMKFVKEEYGMPDITERSRNDLYERCIFWLRTIFQYKLPPAKTLELGCAHGGLVFLMKQAGYVSAGSEMSQWICDFAHETFDIPMLCGKIEALDIRARTYDVVILMDVLEHVSDPVGTLRHVASILTDDGLLVIQTPCYREVGKKTYEEMVSENNPFLPMLAEKEHLYLFNEQSIVRLLGEAGFPYVQFETAIFPYDMFLFAGKKPLAKVEKDAAIRKLLKTPESRTVLAMLDLYEQIGQKEKLLSVCEADRAARLEVITEQGQKIDKLEIARKELDAELETIKSCTSWKITSPLRWLQRRLGRGH